MGYVGSTLRPVLGFEMSLASEWPQCGRNRELRSRPRKTGLAALQPLPARAWPAAVGRLPVLSVLIVSSETCRSRRPIW